MEMSHKLLPWGLMLALGLPAVAQATLISRLAGQAYYDTVLDITWLQNANLANTQTFGVAGVNAGGTMTWDTANLWITAMNANGGTGHLGINNWRLPTLSPVNGSTFNTGFSNNGTTDLGTGATGIGWQFAGDFVSEMGYMFYANLGNLGTCTPNNASHGSCAFQAGSGLANTAPFSNLQSVRWWSGLELSLRAEFAWTFYFDEGNQNADDKRSNLFAWAVRSGDVAATVPEPGTVLLVGAGLLGLMGFKRSKRRGASVI